MPTTSTALTGAKAGNGSVTTTAASEATAAGSAVGGAKLPAGPADFMAMLAQMTQAPPEEALEVAVQSLSGELELDTGTTEEAGESEGLDPDSLADQVLAMAALVAPVAVPAAPTAIVNGAVTDEAPVVSTTESRAAASLLGATLADEPDAAPVEELAPGTGRAEGTGTLISVVSTTAATATGQVVTQVLTQAAPADVAAGNATPNDHVTQRVVHTTVGTNAWANELGTRLTFMAGQGQHSASLRLSPEHLGPLEVRIDMNDDKASVWFGAQNADTRAALTDALPRLRELFAASGMMLADAGVSQQSPRRETADTDSQPRPAAGEVAAEPASASVSSVTHTSLLDLYA